MLGVIGGIAPGSTIDYYRVLVDRDRDHKLHDCLRHD